MAAPVGAIALLGHGPWATPPRVSVYPTPGSGVVAPGAQISFRGVAAEHLRVTVRGASSGPHLGTVRPHSDGKGGSFLADKPFVPGEMVTVSTNQNVRGAADGRFEFTIATPAGAIPHGPLPAAERTNGDVQQFRSEPGLTPAAVTVNRSADARTAGDIFLAPQQGPLQNGPMIIDQNGQLIWFKPLPTKTQAADFRVQIYHGTPVLTWWQGYLGAGAGSGEDVIMDSSYRQIATVRAADGLTADLHEFELTPRGSALITAYYPVYWDATSVHGASRQIVMDSVVQEIDVKTGLLLFQWDSLDHVPLSDAYTETPTQAGSPLDYFHVNSVEEDRDGNLVISARNTWAAYKVNRDTGKIIWTLGGKHSSFKMSPDTIFAFQHDVRVRSDADRTVTLFDNGGGPPRAHEHSRGLTLLLDVKDKTAIRVADYQHAPALAANFEGNLQQLAGGEAFVGWGQQPLLRAVRRARPRACSTDASSRARRTTAPTCCHGTGRRAPRRRSAPPAAAPKRPCTRAGTAPPTSPRGGSCSGDSTTTLTAVASHGKQGFESTIKTGDTQRYLAIQALDAGGRVLGTSAVVEAH